jgi:hypothetical protein
LLFIATIAIKQLGVELSFPVSGHFQVLDLDTIPKVVVRRFGAHEIAPQGQEVESASTS